MKTLYKIDDTVRIARPTRAQEADELISLFEKLAKELSWLPETQLRDYQTEALHLAATVGQELAGGLQVIPSLSAQPLPYCRVWPELATPARSDIAHVTILAFRKEFRGKHDIFWPLCVELWRWCKANGITEIRLEVTPATLRLYQRIGWPLEIIGDLRLHWNEDCYLARMDVATAEASIVKRARTCETYKKLIRQAFGEQKAQYALTVAASI